MALPLSESNLGGVFITSTQLSSSLTVPLIVGDSVTVDSNVISNPGIATDVIVLLQCNATGNVTVTADSCVVAGTPTYASARKAQVVINNTKMYALAIKTTPTYSEFGVQVINSSGATVTFTTLCALDVVSWNNTKQDWHTLKSIFNVALGQQNPLNVSGGLAAGTGDGSFSIQQ